MVRRRKAIETIEGDKVEALAVDSTVQAVDTVVESKANSS